MLFVVSKVTFENEKKKKTNTGRIKLLYLSIVILAPRILALTHQSHTSGPPISVMSPEVETNIHYVRAQ